MNTVVRAAGSASWLLRRRYAALAASQHGREAPAQYGLRDAGTLAGNAASNVGMEM